MKFLHRFILLPLCAVLLLGTACPAYAEEPPGGRIYRALDDSPYQIRFNRDVDFGLIARSVGEDDFYWDSGSDPFVLLWDEAEFDAAVNRGETEFTMTGGYGLPEGSSPELAELWDAGLVTMPAPPLLLVHIRPQDCQTVYSLPDEEIVWEAREGTPFAESVRTHGTVTLRPAEGANPYGDPASLDFTVVWNQDEYEAGMESGAKTFAVSGIYGEPDWNAMKGWARAEGTAKATVIVGQKHNRLLVYRDPAADDLGGMTYAAYVTPNTGFDELSLPDEIMLRLVGGTYQDTRRFIYRWSREEFEKGLESGADSFTVPGSYAPHAGWTAEERQWWDEGLIRVEMPVPELTVHVLRDQELPFTADVRINSYGDLGPYFAFPWVAGMKKAVLAYSLDNKTWHKESWTWDDLPSDQRQNGRFEYTLIAEDEDYNPMITESTAVVYVKVTVEGSPLAGVTEVFDLKPSDGGWDMTPHDDNSGDHGGGGQGESDRSGKEKPDDKPEPEHPSPPDPSSGPDPVKPEPPESGETPQPSRAKPPPPPEAEQMGGAAQTDLAFKGISGPDSPSSEAENGNGKAPPEPDSETPAVPATAAASSLPASPPSASHFPGFAAATAATAVLALGAAAWFRWRGKGG